MRLSIKYKLAALLALFTIVSLGFYFVIATNVFKNDKIAYIYNSALTDNMSLINSLQGQIDYINKLKKIIVSGFNTVDNKLDSLSTQLVNSTPEILQFSIWKKNATGDLVEVYKHKDKVIDPKDAAILIAQYDRNGVRIYGTGNTSYQVSKVRFAVNEPAYYLVTETNLLYYIKNQSLENSYMNALIDESGNPILLEGDLSKDELKKFSNERILGKKIKTATVEETFSGTPYLISYTKFDNSNMTILTLYDKNNALKAMNAFRKQSFLSLIIIICASILISVFLSKGFTTPLNRLYQASVEVAQGNYDIDLKSKSKDEVGALTNQFVNMSQDIKALLERIQKHNEILEQTVKERTAELRELSEIQKAMIDSVDQGFVIIDSDKKIMPVVSSISSEIFEKPPIGEMFSDVIKLEGQDDKASVDEMIDIVLKGDLPFTDGTNLLPQQYTNKNEREIFLDYYPLKREGAKEAIVVVASDKTQEIKALKDLENEKEESKKVLAITARPIVFAEIVKQGIIDVKAIINDWNNDVSKDFVFQVLHTLKGNLSLFNLKNSVSVVHEIENKLSSSKEELAKNSMSVDELKSALKELEVIRDFASDELNLAKLFTDSTIMEVERNKIIEVKALINGGKLDQAQKAIDANILSSPLEEIFKVNEEKAQQIAKSEGKKIKPFYIEAKHGIDYEKYKSVLMTFTHIFNNSVVHGIETPSTREKAGKDKEGMIAIQYKFNGNKHHFLIKDDGGGVDVKKISEIIGKDATDQDIDEFIFGAEMSTRETEDVNAGRGVGMAAVREALSQVGGSVKLKKSDSSGSEFEISFPDKAA